MAKYPWRVQGDIAHGERDPVLTVFMGEVRTDEDGRMYIEQETRDPVEMRLSEIESVLDLVDAKKLDGKRIEQKESRKRLDQSLTAESDKPVRGGS